MAASALTLRTWHPVARAAATSCVVMGCGDVVCQTIQRSRLPVSHDIRHDWARTGRFALIGLTCHGPFFFKGFSALDSFYGPSRDLRTALLKTMTGQALLFPSYLAMFFTYMGALEGKSVPQIGAKLRDSFWPTFVTGCAFWPTVNIFNFRFLGPAHRVAYVNAMGLLWNSYLSYANSGGAASNAAAGASLPRKAMALAAATPDARR